MIVKAWNNGKRHKSGAGYGVKLTAEDRDRYFKRNWDYALLALEGRKGLIKVNTNKKSFWYSECRELISKEIGKWLRDAGKATWRRKPPRIRMKRIWGNKFKLNFID